MGDQPAVHFYVSRGLHTPTGERYVPGPKDRPPGTRHRIITGCGLILDDDATFSPKPLPSIPQRSDVTAWATDVTCPTCRERRLP